MVGRIVAVVPNSNGEFAARVAQLKEQHETGTLMDADFVVAYLVMFMHHMYPRQWQGSKVPGSPVDDLTKGSSRCIGDVPALEPVRWHGDKHGCASISMVRLDALFHQRMLYKLQRSSWLCIREWLSGHRRGLRLVFRVPSPNELLAMQAVGCRCVTAFCEPDELFRTHVGGRDTIGFLLHDLEHMEKFVAAGEDVFFQQVGFFHSMRSLSEVSIKVWFRELGECDGLDYGAQFFQDLEYVISDMNAPAMHCVATLKAKWIVAECVATANADGTDEAGVKRQLSPAEVEGFDRRFGVLLDGWGVEGTSPTWEAFTKVCSTKLTTEEARLVGAFFEDVGRRVARP